MAVILVALLILPLVAVVFDLCVTRIDRRTERPEGPSLKIATTDAVAQQ